MRGLGDAALVGDFRLIFEAHGYGLGLELNDARSRDQELPDLDLKFLWEKGEGVEGCCCDWEAGEIELSSSALTGLPLGSD